MATITENKIIWDAQDWVQGLNEQYGIESANKNIGKTFNSVQAVNPYRVIGYIMPGYLPSSLTNNSVADAVIKKEVPFGNTRGSFQYGITSTKKIVEFSATALTSDALFPHTVTYDSADVTSLHDIVVYTSKVSSAAGNDSATPRVFYSWNSTTKSSWGVGMWAKVSDVDFYDDFMKTRPATPLSTANSLRPHPMIVGDDDLLYIGDGYMLHAFDGQYASDVDGKFYDSVLTIPSTYYMKAFAKYNGFLLIFADENLSGTETGTSSKVFFWDYLSLDPTYIKDLNDDLISEAFLYKNMVGCFTSGRKYDTGLSNTGKIQLFNGNNFEPFVFFNDTIPVRGGVNVSANQIRWNSSGKMYTYGNNLGLSQTLNIIGKGSGSTSGMLSDSSGILLMSSGTTTAGGLQSFSANYDYSAYFQTTSVQPNFSTRQKGRIKRVKLIFGNTNGATADKLTVKLYYDRGGSSVTIASNIQEITADTIIMQYEHDSSGNPLPDFESVSLKCEWGEGTVHTSAPWIQSAEIEFETINI